MKHQLKQDGFSLLELLIALFLLTIGIFSVVSMQVTAIKSNSIANVLSSATALAQEAMDDIMAWSISDSRLNSDNSNITYDLNPTDTGSNNITIPGGGTFRATYTTDANNPTAGVTRIDVQIFVGTEITPKVTLSSYKRTT